MFDRAATPGFDQLSRRRKDDSMLERFLKNRGDATQPLDAYVNVVTPENIAFNYQVAGPHTRFLAFFLDGLFLFIFFFIMFVIGVILMMLLSTVLAFSGFGSAIDDFFLAASGWSGVIVWAIWWSYAAWCETYMNGQTLGKRILGLRVTTTDGRPINGIQATARNLIRAADIYPFFTLLVFVHWIGGNPDIDPESAAILGLPFPTCIVAICFMSMTARRQRLGDLVCGTMVVNEERKYAADLAIADDPRTPALAEYIPGDFVVSRSMAKALAHYVDRRRYFSPARRAEIARHLGEPLLRIFNMRSDTSHDLLLCALYYRTFLTATGGDAELSSQQPPPALPYSHPAESAWTNLRREAVR